MRNGREGHSVDIQTAPADQALSEGTGNNVMSNPLWMLVPWLVFALAAGIKCWRLTTLFRNHLLGVPSRSERLRQMLERIWAKDQQYRMSNRTRYFILERSTDQNFYNVPNQNRKMDS